jgi:hypothetical protein
VISRSEFERLHEPFYINRLTVSAAFSGRSRLTVFRSFCEGKKVLHIGCAQFPRFDPDTNLHIQLAPFCAILDGFDAQQDNYDAMRSAINNGVFLSSLTEARTPYDVVLIPEVMEHVANVEEFLKSIVPITAARFIVTVPDLFQCYARHFCYDASKQEFLEAVHPDHNCWYSPYTFVNALRKFTPWNVESVYWLNNISLMAVCVTTIAK